MAHFIPSAGVHTKGSYNSTTTRPAKFDCDIRSTAKPMIARIRRMHEMVAGTTSSGEAYRANDPELLNWVHGTAAYGFLQAYHMYVQPLSSSERDRYYAEGVPAASSLRGLGRTDI